MGLPQLLVEGQRQGKLRSIEGLVLRASGCDTKIGHQPRKEISSEEEEAFSEIK